LLTQYGEFYQDDQSSFMALIMKGLSKELSLTKQAQSHEARPSLGFTP